MALQLFAPYWLTHELQVPCQLPESRKADVQVPYTKQTRLQGSTLMHGDVWQ